MSVSLNDTETCQQSCRVQMGLRKPDWFYLLSNGQNVTAILCHALSISASLCLSLTLSHTPPPARVYVHTFCAHAHTHSGHPMHLSSGMFSISRLNSADKLYCKIGEIIVKSCFCGTHRSMNPQGHSETGAKYLRGW